MQNDLYGNPFIVRNDRKKTKIAAHERKIFCLHICLKSLSKNSEVKK